MVIEIFTSVWYNIKAFELPSIYWRELVPLCFWIRRNIDIKGDSPLARNPSEWMSENLGGI